MIVGVVVNFIHFEGVKKKGTIVLFFFCDFIYFYFVVYVTKSYRGDNMSSNL